ncbi:MAG: zf-HC2 domain-containing protein [Vicinamibacteria bacterium]
MQCEKVGDERLVADKMDLLYGEADAEVRARVEAHLAGCAPCRDEMAGLRAVRGDLAAWRRPAPRAVFTPRGLVVPRWLAAAAVFLAALGVTLGATGYLQMRQALAAQEARAAALELRQQEAQRALQAALARPPATGLDDSGLLARVDARVDEKLRASESRQAARLDTRLASWDERAEAQRRLDLARVAAGLSYLDGRHGQQLARTNELMGYVLAASEKR